MKQPLAYIHPRSLKYLREHLDALIRGRLWLKVLIAMGLGIGVGIAIGPSAGWVSSEVSQVLGNWLALPGYLFLAMVQMVVIPLIFSSVIRGLAAGEDLETLKRLGGKAVLYFIGTTTLAITLGLTLASIIQPGKYIDSSLMNTMVENQAPVIDQAELPDMTDIPSQIVDLLPQNPIGSIVDTEMLQIVIFAVFIGIALIALPNRQAKPLLDLLGSLQAVSIKVVRWAMLLAPLAVFGLMARLTSTVGFDLLVGLGVYVGTVIAGLIALMIAYLLIVTLLAKRSPREFMRAVRAPQLLAFSTSSSAAVMPLSIETADSKLGIRPSISQFIVPLGATINMDGTALYQGVATVFLAQVFGVDLSLAALAFVVVTAVSASIGAPATPGVGIVILATVLEGVGIPASGIALIIGVDRILDMSRTVANVTGDLTACTVMDRWVGGTMNAEEQLQREKEREEKRRETGEDVITDNNHVGS